MRAVGRYTGETTCGFTTGKVYNVTLAYDPMHDWIWVLADEGQLPYSNLKLLSKYWDIPYSGERRRTK